jgi:hypothetical protein
MSKSEGLRGTKAQWRKSYHHDVIAKDSRPFVDIGQRIWCRQVHLAKGFWGNLYLNRYSLMRFMQRHVENDK